MKLSNKSYIGRGQVPVGIGAVLKGWDITEEEYRDPSRLPVVDFRAMTEKCPHDCFHCYTDKNKKTLTLKEIKYTIDQLADHKTHAIDYLGEGEPTIDPDFFEIIEYTSGKGIRPVIYTDAATKMRDRDFVRRVYDSGSSVVPKCDSLWNAEYQNWVVEDNTGMYYGRRDHAIAILMEEGFSAEQEDGTTRLGFDMVVSSRNVHEVERTLRCCRDNNLWVMFSFYLPAGRSGSEEFDNSLFVEKDEKRKMAGTVRKIDAEYGLYHPTWNNFMTTPCIEFMQIYGDGRVSPCPGNETIIGNIKTKWFQFWRPDIEKMEKRILKRFPGHDCSTFDGNCLYRESF
jgi:MoaA/NifB/PqqE/SkfB family radical SAM enzyme